MVSLDVRDRGLCASYSRISWPKSIFLSRQWSRVCRQLGARRRLHRPRRFFVALRATRLRAVGSARTDLETFCGHRTAPFAHPDLLLAHDARHRHAVYDLVDLVGPFTYRLWDFRDRDYEHCVAAIRGATRSLVGRARADTLARRRDT